jgi:hypothetical protein
VTFRASCLPDGRSASHYHVPGEGLLSIARFDDWLTQIVDQSSRVAVLVIREYRDADGALHGCILERRCRTAEGAYCGDPARVEVGGAAFRVRAYRSTPEGRLEEIDPRLQPSVDRSSRDSLFDSEDRTVRDAYGETARIVSVRAPSAREELVGFSSMVHLLTQDGRELACGIGWHGTTPFLIQGEFPPDDGQTSDGQTSHGQTPDGQTSGAADTADGGIWRDLLTADQAVWLRYAERYEHLVILDIRAEGTTGEVLVLTGDAGGSIAWHLIDGDGVDLWRKAPEEMIADTPPPQATSAREANDQPPQPTDAADRARRARGVHRIRPTIPPGAT